MERPTPTQIVGSVSIGGFLIAFSADAARFLVGIEVVTVPAGGGASLHLGPFMLFVGRVRE
jgi:hypothetical protein